MGDTTASRAVLGAALSAFVKDDLAAANPMWLAGEWNNSSRTYTRLFRKFTRTCCSMCQHPRRVGSGSLDIRLTPAAVASPAGMDAFLQGVQLPPSVVSCLDAGDASGRRTVWVYLLFFWPVTLVGHASIMMFDLKRKLQVVFDPDWGVDMPNTPSSGLCRRRFHPKYRNLTANMCAPALRADSLQRKVERRMHVEEQGVCGILTMLVMLCCVRHNFYNPKEVAALLIPVLSRAGVANQIITWYDAMTNKNGAAFLDHVLPRSAQNKCSAHSTATRTLCSRKSCKDGDMRAFCWQHRYYGINRDAPSKKCSAPQAPCAA
jgi:hypothetical protein